MVLLIPLICITAGCGPRDNVLKKIANEGKINNDAAMVNEAIIEISASDQYIWDLLVNIPDWRKWNPDITEVLANGISYKGDNFVWRWGSKINTAVHLFEPHAKLSWFSKNMAYRSIIVWEIKKISDQKTQVTLKESRDGFFMHFRSSTKHRQKLESWLENLKNRAEVVHF